MTKKEMIKALVLAWVRNAKDRKAREQRFICHDSKESKLDRIWTKGGIESIMNQFNNGSDIDALMVKYCW